MSVATRSVFPAAILLFNVVSLGAQPISGVVSPAVVSPGQQATLTITAVQNVNLPTPCVFQDVRMGSPTGPSFIQILCLQVITPLNAGNSMSATWTPPQTGTFWFQVPVIGFPDQFFCLEVRSQTSQSPVLTAGTTAQVGQDLVMSLSASQLPGASYIAAASLTSNTGISLGGTTLCLDQDLLFALSFPIPNPSVFSNFTGVTDAVGNAGGLTIHIPNVTALTWIPLKAQAAVIDPATLAPVFTNGLAFTIQP